MKTALLPKSQLRTFLMSEHQSSRLLTMCIVYTIRMKNVQFSSDTYQHLSVTSDLSLILRTFGPLSQMYVNGWYNLQTQCQCKLIVMNFPFVLKVINNSLVDKPDLLKASEKPNRSMGSLHEYYDFSETARYNVSYVQPCFLWTDVRVLEWRVLMLLIYFVMILIWAKLYSI